MLGTIIALIIAIFYYFYPLGLEMPQNQSLVPLTIMIVSTLFFLFQKLTFVLSWTPIEQTERNSTPHIMQMLKMDWLVDSLSYWFVFFILISFGIALDLLFFKALNQRILILIWIILLGITIDFWRQLLKRLACYLNPFEVTDIFSKKGKEFIREEKEVELCESIDGLTDIGIKAIHKTGTGLCNEAIDRIQQLAKLFLEAQKSISHHEQDSETQALGIKDKVTYVLFYLYQRLELIFDQALGYRLEPICSSIIAALGKITISASKFDITLANYPLSILGRLTKEAQEKKLYPVSLKSTGILLEVARTIVTQLDVKYLEIKDAFISIIEQLDGIAKETFRHDKNISMQVLTHPFQELKGILNNEKLNEHPDKPAIEEKLDAVIAEFNMLEMVLRTIPPIPKKVE